MGVFIIGLPTALRARLIARAREHGLQVGFALAGADRSGVLKLVPHDRQARADLENYCDGVADWTSLQIIQMPYVPIVEDLQASINVLQGFGGGVVKPTPGQEGWPAIKPDRRYGGSFNDDLYAAILQHLGWQGQGLPSQRFERSAARHSDYLILQGALDDCDNVHRSRYEFLYKACDALEEFCRKRGAISESLFAFFAHRGLHFATTGGIKTTLRVIQRGRQQGAALEAHLHLKEGDGTTPQAAARIYFQHFERDNQFRLALFYAGPHPENDIDRSIVWEPD